MKVYSFNSIIKFLYFIWLSKKLIIIRYSCIIVWLIMVLNEKNCLWIFEGIFCWEYVYNRGLNMLYVKLNKLNVKIVI